MINKDNHPEQVDRLRQRAEAAFHGTASPSSQDQEAMTVEETQRTVHELRVHQIELEMQNEELRRAQAELDASRARYFDLYDLAPVGYCTLNEQGIILQANLSAATLLEVDRNALVQQPISGFIHKEDQDIYYLLHNKLVSTGDPQSGELRMVQSDGTPIWIQLESAVAHDQNGAAMLRIVLNDVTTRKQVEETLREREEEHWAILQTAMAGFWLVDTQGHLIEVNEAYCRMSGYSVHELLTMRISQLEAAETASTTNAHIQKVLAGDGTRFEARHRRKDGSIFDVEVSFQFRAVDGGQLVAFLQDITERKRAQAALDAERARYFSFYNLAPVGFVTVSEPGLILEANLPLANLLGVARDALPKQPFSHFIYKEDADLYYHHRKLLFKTGDAQSCELRMVKHDGAPFWVQLAATIAINDGGVTVSRLVLNDISANKQAEAEREKLATQNRQLQKAESLGRMAGAIAHHFNNQLQGVLSNLELAIDYQPRREKSVDHLNSAVQAIRKAAEVSTLMLTYLGQTHCKHEPLDLSTACVQSMTLLRVAVPKDVSLETSFPTPGPTINGNANQIQQVLTNLVANAWEASGSGQNTIRLAVKTVAAENIPNTNRFPIDWRPQDTAYACMEVADSGYGVAPQNIEKIFDPFFSSKFSGRGLGLSVVLGIARSGHGAITVESTPDQGSTFRLFFPVTTKTIPQQPPPPAAPNPNIPDDTTVLVVDDEPGVREAVTLALEQFGFTVLTAADGVEAVEVFRQHQNEIDCVLSDVSMPRMGGWEALTALRKLSPDIPVILSSGYSESLVMEGDHPELPEIFLAKPYEVKSLISAIRQIVASTAPIRNDSKTSPPNSGAK